MKNQIANHSYHNTLILNDCLDLKVRQGDEFIKTQTDRYETDDCGNITHIDGQKVVGGDYVYRLEENYEHIDEQENAATSELQDREAKLSNCFSPRRIQKNHNSFDDAWSEQ